MSGLVGGGIKSVQRGSIAIAYNVASGTATITAVDPNKAYVIVTGQNSADAGQWSVVLTNATTVTATHPTGSLANTFNFQVVESY